MPNNKSTAPKLQFIESIQWQGFTSAELMRLSGNSTRAIRELVQNSLDAAVERGDGGIAEVHFIVKETNHAEIPGMEEYKTVLNNAIESNKKQGDQAKSVVDSLSASAAREKSPTLFVLDNGIGLNEKRMCAMYNNGMSEKEGGRAAGSYGNGHFTTFVLSGLRYVFYGGINNGASIFGGHAIIASHKDNEIRFGKDGFYVSELKYRCKDNEEPYVFPDEKKMPDANFIQEQIRFIRKEWKSGSVIAVPAFNHFWGKPDNVEDTIVKSVVMNFFVAICDGKLRVTVRVNGNEKTISSKDVKSILNDCKEHGRGPGQGFPSGTTVWNSYQTLLSDNKHIVNTPKGKVELLIRKGGSKNVALCRNGMWITKEIPRLRQASFSDKEPFDALLLVDKNSGEEIYKLFKKAEGPDHIDIKDLDDRMGTNEQKREFNKCLDAIAAKINELVEDRKSEEFPIRDFIVFEGGEAVNSPRSMNSNKHNKTGEATSVSVEERIRAGKKGKRTSKSALKSGNILSVKISSKQRSRGITDIRFKPDDECENVEFRMRVDRGTDATCTGSLKPEDWEAISLKSVKIDGKAIPLDDFTPKDSDKKVGVLIGAVVAGKSHNMTIEYDAPPSFLGNHAIKWFFLRRKKSSPAMNEKQ